MALQSFLQRVGARDAIVHIGPGALYDEARYDRQKGRIFIFEPDPERARALGFLTAKNAKLRIIEAAASEVGERQLYKYNFPRLDALQKLRDFDAPFPGLYAQGATDVAGVTIRGILSRLPEETASNDLLVLDSLGEGLFLLERFEVAGGLARFAAIILRSAKAGYFADGDVDAESAWLVQRGFNPPICIDDDDPEFPVLFFSRNILAEELDQKSAALAEMAEELEACRKNLKDLKDEKILLLQEDLEELQARYSKAVSLSEESASLIATAREMLARVKDAVSALPAKEQKLLGDAFREAGVSAADGDSND